MMVGSTDDPKSPGMLTRTAGSEVFGATILRIWSLIASMRRAWLTTSSPFSVSATPGTLLSNKSVSRSCCRRLSCALTAGWVTPRRFAALVKLRRSATAISVRRTSVGILVIRSGLTNDRGGACSAPQIDVDRTIFHAYSLYKRAPGAIGNRAKPPCPAHAARVDEHAEGRPSEAIRTVRSSSGTRLGKCGRCCFTEDGNSLDLT